MLATTNDGVDDDAHLLKFRKKTWGFILKGIFCGVTSSRNENDSYWKQSRTSKGWNLF